MSLSVNGQPISESDVQQEMRHHPVADAARARSEATRALVVRALLLQEADRRGVAGTHDEEQRIRALTEQAVAVPEVPEDACRAYYEAHRARFRGPDLFAPSHILFGARSEDIEGRVQAKAAAEQVLGELLEHPERFERLARTRSACPSGANGGSLGQIQRGETVGEFERALCTTEPGTLHPRLVETEFGFHVLRLDARAEGRPLPYAAVADRVRIYLRDRAWRQAVHAFIAELAAGAAIDAGGAPLDLAH